MTAAEARDRLAELEGKALEEAAQTYLLGVLDADFEEDIADGPWRASFDDEDERERAEAAVDGVRDSPERSALLRLAMLDTLDARPDTEELFVRSVADAGKSMFVFELGAVTLAAALLIREVHRKGRSYEHERTEVTQADGSRTVTVREVRYASDGPFAKLLVALGLQGPPV
jgi:hypothetical protein